MKTMHTVVTVCLVLTAVSMIGCTTKVKLVVNNTAAKPVPVTISGGGRGQESLGILAGYADGEWFLKYKNSNLPAAIDLAVGEDTKTFTVSQKGSKVFRYWITPEGKFEARPKKLAGDYKKDTKTPIGDPEPEVTGD